MKAKELVDEKWMNIIKVLSKIYALKLPANSIYTEEDLINEGWIILDKVKGSSKTNFKVYLKNALRNKFKDILRSEYTRKKRTTTISISNKEKFDKLYTNTYLWRNPEKDLLLKQLLQMLAVKNPELVEMVTKGIPRELFLKIKKHMRKKQFRKGKQALDGKIRIIKSLIEDFFEINLVKINGITSKLLDDKNTELNIINKHKRKRRSKMAKGKKKMHEHPSLDQLQAMAKKLKLKKYKNLDAEELLKKIDEHCDSLDDDEWGKLSEEIQDLSIICSDDDQDYLPYEEDDEEEDDEDDEEEVDDEDDDEEDDEEDDEDDDDDDDEEDDEEDDDDDDDEDDDDDDDDDDEDDDDEEDDDDDEDDDEEVDDEEVDDDDEDDDEEVVVEEKPKKKKVAKKTTKKKVAKKTTKKKVEEKPTKKSKKKKVEKKSKKKKVEKKAEKKAEKKSTKKGKVTVSDKIFKIIDKRKKGINTAQLKTKTGYDDKKISNAIFKLKKEGLIEAISKGVYASKKKKKKKK